MTGLEEAAAIAATISVARTLLKEIPAGIIEVRNIMLAWNNADPSAEDFDSLVAIAEASRPKDPLGKV
jgi:hypothetical protein